MFFCSVRCCIIFMIRIASSHHRLSIYFVTEATVHLDFCYEFLCAYNVFRIMNKFYCIFSQQGLLSHPWD